MHCKYDKGFNYKCVYYEACLCSLLGGRERHASTTDDTSEGNEEEPKVEPSRQSDERDLGVGRHERGLDGSQGGSGTEERDRSRLDCTSKDGNEEGSALNERRGEEVDEKLLVLCGDLEGPEVLEGRKERLDSLEVDTLSVQG